MRSAMQSDSLCSWVVYATINVALSCYDCEELKCKVYLAFAKKVAKNTCIYEKKVVPL